MNLYPKQFLGLDPFFTDWEKAAVAILPFPYEQGVSYGKGCAKAPDTVIEASFFLELYDETLKKEPYRMGISTVMPPSMPSVQQEMFDFVYKMTKTISEYDKFIVLLGGDHSITSGHFLALKEKYETLSVIQLDAHCDLRDSYYGSRLSHACVMSRIREHTDLSLQIGIRSMCAEEATKIERDNIYVCTMQEYRQKLFDLDLALGNLSEEVFITIDVDAFDWSVIMSTGTPEPGGFTWDEALMLLGKIFLSKNVVGFDVVELSCPETDRNSPFAVAKLIYRMLGFKMASEVKRGKMYWPEEPMGPLFGMRCNKRAEWSCIINKS